jgi:hypothetical protein
MPAIIPTYGSSQVQTVPIATPQARPASPDAFGASLGPALGQMGEAVQKMSDFNDHATVLGKLNDWKSRMVDLGYSQEIDPETGQPKGYFLRKGEAAKGLEDEFKADMEENLFDIKQGLQNDRQRAAFDHLVQKQIHTYNIAVVEHEVKEKLSLNAVETKTAVDLALNNIAQSYQSPEIVSQNIEDGINAIKAQNVIKGYAPDSQISQDTLTQFESSAHKTVVDSLIKTRQIWKAKQYFDEFNKAEPETDENGKPIPGTEGSVFTRADQLAIEKDLKPKLDAWSVDSVLTRVDEEFKGDSPSADFGIDKRYEAVKKVTEDPHIRDLAFKELERQERVHNQAVKDLYDANSGHIFMTARQDWNNKQETDPAKIMMMPEFARLAEKDQERVLDKIDTENRLIASDRHKVETDERIARNEERRTAAEERRAANEARREKDRATKEKWNETFNHFNANPEELAQMTNDEFAALAGDVSHADYTRLTAKRAKLVTPQALSHAVIEAGTLTGLLRKAGITDPEEVKTNSLMAQHFVNAVQKEAKHVLSPAEIQAAIIQGLQHVAVNVNTSRLGIPTGSETEAKRRMEVKNPAAIIIPPDVEARADFIEKERGTPMSPERRRKLYDEILRTERRVEDAR